MVPPDPIPNSAVKRYIADDSVGSPHVKVGHRQGLIPETLVVYINGGGFSFCFFLFPLWYDSPPPEGWQAQPDGVVSPSIFLKDFSGTCRKACVVGLVLIPIPLSNFLLRCFSYLHQRSKSLAIAGLLVIFPIIRSHKSILITELRKRNWYQSILKNS